MEPSIEDTFSKARSMEKGKLNGQMGRSMKVNLERTNWMVMANINGVTEDGIAENGLMIR